MNVFHKLTLRSLRKNKIRTAVTIIGIILSASMICAVTTFASSLQNFAVENAVYQTGNWHSKTTRLHYEKIANSSKVEYHYLSGSLGYAIAEGCVNEFKPYLYIMQAENEYFSNMPIHLTSGRLPQNQGEIIIPEHLIYNGGVNIKVGDVLTLDIGKRMLDGSVLGQADACYTYDENNNEIPNGEEFIPESTGSFTVVGIYERPDFESIAAPGYTAITFCQRQSILENDNPFEVYYRMKNPRQLYDFKKENNIWGDNNRSVLTYLGSFQYSSFMTVITGCAVIVISLIMFGSVSLIYNAFAISVSERTRDFGLLSSIGATKRQMKRMVLFEAFSVALVGIPIGVLSGIGGIGVTLMIIGGKFTSISGYPIPMRICVSPVSVIIAVLVSIITVLISASLPSIRATRVSAIQAIRMSKDIKPGKIKNVSSITIKIFRIPGLLAGKYYQRSKSKYRTTVLSLFMSIVLFVSAASFTDTLTQNVTDIKSGNGYDIIFYSDKDGFKSVSPESLYEQYKAVSDINNMAYTRSSYIYSDISIKHFNSEAKKYLQKGGMPDTYETGISITFVNDESFKKLLYDNKLSESEYFDFREPKAIAVDGNLFFDIDGEKYVSAKLLKNGSDVLSAAELKDIDDCAFAEYEYNENGEIEYYVYINMKTGEKIRLLPKEALTFRNYCYGTIIYENPFFISSSANIKLIYPQSQIEAVMGKDHSLNTYNYLFTSSDHKKSFEAIKDIAVQNGFAAKNVIDYAESVEENRNVITIIKVFSYGFITLISLIAAANVFNTLSTNINLRKREFAVLKSVGMSPRDFNRMMNYECLLYGSRAILLGLPVSVLVSYLISRVFASGYVTEFRLPLSSMAIAVLSVFLVVFATMQYSISKIKKANTIDVLKNENI